MNLKKSLIFQILHHIISNIKKRPRIIGTYRKIRLEKSRTDGYILLLMGYAGSPNRDFERYLRNVVGLDEDDIQSI